MIRERVRHPLKLRNLTVTKVLPVGPQLLRITLTGADLEGFTAPGPGDHVKLFFPDEDGTLTTPIITEQGITRPENGTIISRDYTPLEYRPEERELDIDFVVHGDDGPASRWAAAAKPGSTLPVAGPRGSRLVPDGMTSAVIVADETALPAASRWLASISSDVPVAGLFFVDDPETASYLKEEPNQKFQWFAGEDLEIRLEEALRAVPFNENTFVFLAGEASTIAPLRRYLRRELGLSKEQVDAHGYWKRGVTNLDHHAPLDPQDPD